jgi:aminoglycoside phosphotransferase (APT) family kinase protein
VPADGLDLPAPFGDGDCILHLDLHPGNVIMGRDGAVVIDWTNACVGPAGFDVATTWVVTATGDVDVPRWLAPLAGPLRRRFVDRFVDEAGRGAARRWIALAGERRLDDPNTLPAEAAHVRDLMVREAAGSAD